MDCDLDEQTHLDELTNSLIALTNRLCAHLAVMGLQAQSNQKLLHVVGSRELFECWDEL